MNLLKNLFRKKQREQPRQNIDSDVFEKLMQEKLNHSVTLCVWKDISEIAAHYPEQKCLFNNADIVKSMPWKDAKQFVSNWDKIDDGWKIHKKSVLGIWDEEQGMWASVFGCNFSYSLAHPYWNEIQIEWIDREKGEFKTISRNKEGDKDYGKNEERP